VGDHATSVEIYVPHSAPNEIFMALRRRRDTADDLQGRAILVLELILVLVFILF